MLLCDHASLIDAGAILKCEKDENFKISLHFRVNYMSDILKYVDAQSKPLMRSFVHHFKQSFGVYRNYFKLFVVAFMRCYKLRRFLGSIKVCSLVVACHIDVNIR